MDRAQYERWCEQNDQCADEPGWLIWQAALRSTHTQQPFAWATLREDELIALFDAPTPAARSMRQIPLYAAPVSEIKRTISDPELKLMWDKYYLDDPIGFARAFERFLSR